MASLTDEEKTGRLKVVIADVLRFSFHIEEAVIPLLTLNFVEQYIAWRDVLEADGPPVTAKQKEAFVLAWLSNL